MSVNAPGVSKCRLHFYYTRLHAWPIRAAVSSFSDPKMRRRRAVDTMLWNPHSYHRFRMNLCHPLVALCMALPQPVTTALQVELSFSKSVTSEPFTGRVFVIASKTAISDKGTPPGPNWFKPYPFFSQDVTKWNPDTPLKFQPQYGLPAWDK